MTYKNSDGTMATTPAAERDTLQALKRGAMGRCPSCGEGKLFTSYLKVAESCDACGEELHHHRADDAPPYFVMLIAGHILGGLALTIEQVFSPSLWVHAGIFVPLTGILVLGMLPPVKGALVGLQWALRMHGFDPKAVEVDDHGLRPSET